MSTSSFAPFLSFPPEIHGLILSSCSTNDRTCLRLTCKYLYNLSSTPKEALSLAYSDPEHLCKSSEAPPIQPLNSWHSRYQHRFECHSLCYAEALKRAQRAGRPAPKTHHKCSTSRWADHCECFTGKTKLHQRLRTWMPRGLYYCSQCKRFTKRKPQHKGRCYHGKPKARSAPNNFWTHRSRRGGFGRKLWKKWFSDQSMNRWEARLRSAAAPEKRAAGGNLRYDFRELRAKEVNTRPMRYDPGFPSS